jgi:LmbE family N-acetylglucosaminyl deacetylase
MTSHRSSLVDDNTESGIQRGSRKQIIIDLMQWIFLSPHFDDAALSCGGIIWEEVHRGSQVSIWTVCSAAPKNGQLSAFAEQLHTRWGTGPQAIEQRRQEDMASCSRLGATYRHLGLYDCIYRTSPKGEFLYPSEESLNGSLHPLDQRWIEILHERLKQDIPSRARLVCPLTFGNHVDHQLTRAAAEKLNIRLWYYADYPYVQRRPARLEELAANGWQTRHFRVSKAGLIAWQDSVAAHASQISTFWPNLPAMQEALQDYWVLENATNLWRK